MKKVVLSKTGSFPTLTFCLISCLMLCSACNKTPPPDSNDAGKTEASAVEAEMPTGLVKNPVKLSHTADATKWMDMASTKTPAQIAKEAKLAKDAKDAKDAKEAKEARDAKEAQARKLAAEAKEAQDAKLAAEARANAKAKEAAKVLAAATAPSPTVPKPAPSVAPAPSEQLTLKVLSSVKPKFPHIAAQSGVTSGTVTARFHVETDGRVSRVDVVKASPPRLFNSEVIAAATQWKYAPLSKPLTTMVEFNFKLDE